MRASISILLGIVIIIICYQAIKKELNRAIIKANSKYSHISDDNAREIISNLEDVETTVNELNRSFYEMLSDLEGKYSVHDKEIEILSEKMDKLIKSTEDSMSKISNKTSENKNNLDKIFKRQNSQERKLQKSKNLENNPEASQFKETQVKESVRENIDKDFIKKIQSKTTVKKESLIISHKEDLTLDELNMENKKTSIESLNELEKETLRSNIIELRQKGYSINQIAKKLDVGIGELQLVLNLQRK